MSRVYVCTSALSPAARWSECGLTTPVGGCRSRLAAGTVDIHIIVTKDSKNSQLAVLLELRNAKIPATMITVTYCSNNHGHLVWLRAKCTSIIITIKETSGHFHSCADTVSFKTLLRILDLFSVSSHTVTVIFGSRNPLFWIPLAWLTVSFQPH